MPQINTLLRRFRRCYLVAQIALGWILIFDASPNNNFVLAGIEVSNVALGVFTLVVSFLLWRLHPKFWTLPIYLFPMMFIGIQRTLFVISDPDRAKVIVGLVVMAILPLFTVSWWAREYGADDNN